MSFQSVAIQSPGSMGGALAAVLHARGLRVQSALAGRSEETRTRAARAGIEDAGDLDALLAEADLVLSVMPPGEAPDFAARCADVLAARGRRICFVDANAVSPATAGEMQKQIEAAGSVFVDGGIIGGPPRSGGPAPRLYLSGPDAHRLEALGGESDAGAIEVRVIGDQVGRASGLKMAYAGLTKGTMTLHAAVLITAARLGLEDELERELSESQPQALARMSVLPFLPADAERWIGEMQEIAATFAAAGVTPRFHEGAESIYRVMAATPFAEETRETLDRCRTLREAVRVFAEHLD